MPSGEKPKILVFANGGWGDRATDEGNLMYKQILVPALREHSDKVEWKLIEGAKCTLQGLKEVLKEMGGVQFMDFLGHGNVEKATGYKLQVIFLEHSETSVELFEKIRNANFVSCLVGSGLLPWLNRAVKPSNIYGNERVIYFIVDAPEREKERLFFECFYNPLIELLKGATFQEAYDRTIEKYDENIAKLPSYAQYYLVHDRNGFKCWLDEPDRRLVEAEVPPPPPPPGGVPRRWRITFKRRPFRGKLQVKVSSQVIEVPFEGELEEAEAEVEAEE